MVDTIDLILQGTTTRYTQWYGTWDILHSKSLECTQTVSNKIEKAKTEQNARENRKRQNRVFEVCEKVIVKRNSRLKNKLSR